MTFAPDDIEIKEFVPTMRGYDRTEVRSFLRAVAEDVRRLEEKLEHQKQRSLEHASLPTMVAQPPTASSVVVDGPALQDSIRELTQAVKLLALQASLPRLGDTAPPSTPERAKPNVRGSVLLAGIDPTRSTSTVPQRVAPDGFAPSTEVSSAHAASNGLWTGPERRSSQRPWSGRPRVESAGATNTSAASTKSSPRAVPHQTTPPTDSSTERSTTVGAESITVPRGSNRELIDAYLQQALHPAQASVDSHYVHTDDTAELKGTDEAPRTNVVPLMRAV